MKTHTLRKHKTNPNHRILTFTKGFFAALLDADAFAVSLCISKLKRDLKVQHGIDVSIDYDQRLELEDHAQRDASAHPALEGRRWFIKTLFMDGVMSQPSVDLEQILSVADLFIKMLRKEQG